MNWTYAAIMSASIGTGILLSRQTQRSLRLSWQQRLGIGLGAFCGAMIGAKLPFVLADWPGLLSGAAWFGNGKTIVLGLVGGYIGVEAVKWALDLHVKTGDSFAAPVAASVAIGRLGCYSAGCCYGTATNLPWGVDFGDGLPRHPTQLYESVFHLLAALGLWQLQRRGLLRGQLIKLYLIGYFVYRFVTEFIRPEAELWFALTGYQWAVLMLIPCFALLWRRDAQAATQRAPG